jgi:hypothetical protein
MSVIIASGESISKSPLNMSPAKMMYSFPKSARFSLQKDNSSKTYFYELPSVKSMRSSAIGFGNKYDFTNTVNKKKRKDIPYYDIPSDFDKKKPHSPAFTFGISREYYAKVLNEKEISHINNIAPGPGMYDYIKPFGNDALKFSLFGRDWARAKVIKGKEKVIIPGPGRYDHIASNEEGKYPISSFRNTARSSWSKSKAKRFTSVNSNAIYLF